MASITLKGVKKRFRRGVVAVAGVDLTVADGEFIVLVGPSGCGKTTLLRMVAGLEQVTEGRVLLGARDVTDLEPQKRNVAMVFQSYALFPHMTVAENIGVGMRLRRVPKARRRQRVNEVAELLRLTSLLDRRPSELSGGQRQRVAIGRALVREPSAFLMDEPLSNLDAKLRTSMRTELARLHQRLGSTTMYVTHDQIEAMTLGQRVAVVREGVLQQCDTPRGLFERPVNLFVAAFIGSPSMNLVQVPIEDRTIHLGRHRLPLHPDHRLEPSPEPRVLGIRPSAFVPADAAPARWPRIDVRVEAGEDFGSEHHLMFLVSAPAVQTDVSEAEEESVLLSEAGTSVMTARLHGPQRARVGDLVRLAVDPGAFHFFDLASGDVLASPISGAGSQADGLVESTLAERPVATP